MKTSFVLLFLSSCVGIAACGKDEHLGATCGPATGVVERVLDGDTVELHSGVTIRYLLANTPEIAHSASEVSECYGDEATLLNKKLVLGVDVELEYDQDCTDRYDRTLAYVRIDDRLVNRILVERGYAVVNVYPPNDRYADQFKAVEEIAKSESRGLWGSCQ